MMKQKSKNHSKHTTSVSTTSHFGQLDQQQVIGGGQAQPKKLVSKNSRSKGNLKKQNTNTSQQSDQNIYNNNSTAQKQINNNNNNSISMQVGANGSILATTIEVDLTNNLLDNDASNSSGSVTQKNKPPHYSFSIDQQSELHNHSYQQPQQPVYQQLDLKQLNNYANNKNQQQTQQQQQQLLQQQQNQLSEMKSPNQKQTFQQSNQLGFSKSNSNISSRDGGNHSYRPTGVGGKSTSQSLVNISYQPSSKKQTKPKASSGVKSFAYQQQIQQIQNKQQNQQSVSNFQNSYSQQQQFTNTQKNGSEILHQDSTPSPITQLQQQNTFQDYIQQQQLISNKNNINKHSENCSNADKSSNSDITRQISQVSSHQSREDQYDFVMINDKEMIDSMMDQSIKNKQSTNSKQLQQCKQGNKVQIHNDNIKSSTNNSNNSQYKTSQNDNLMRLIQQTKQQEIQNCSSNDCQKKLFSSTQEGQSGILSNGSSSVQHQKQFKTHHNQPQIFSPQPHQKYDQNSSVYLLNHLSPHSSFKNIMASSTTTHKTSQQVNLNSHNTLVEDSGVGDQTHKHHLSTIHSSAALYNQHGLDSNSNHSHHRNHLNYSYGASTNSIQTQNNATQLIPTNLVSNFSHHASSPQPSRRGTAAILSKEPSHYKNPTINQNQSQRNFQNSEQLKGTLYSQSYHKQQTTQKQHLVSQQQQQRKTNGMQRSHVFGTIVGQHKYQSDSNKNVTNNSNNINNTNTSNQSIEFRPGGGSQQTSLNDHSNKNKNNNNTSLDSNNNQHNKSQNSISNTYYHGSTIVASSKQVRGQNKSQSLSNNYGNIGNLNKKSDIIGREMTVQSFRDKDHLNNNNLKHQNSNNPFEVNDTIIEQEMIIHSSNTQRPAALQQQNSQYYYENDNQKQQQLRQQYSRGQVRQPIETQRSQYNHNNLSTNDNESDSYLNSISNQVIVHQQSTSDQLQNNLLKLKNTASTNSNFTRQSNDTPLHLDLHSNNNTSFTPSISKSIFHNTSTSVQSTKNSHQAYYQDSSRLSNNNFNQNGSNSVGGGQGVLKVQSEPQVNVFMKSKYNDNVQNRNTLLNQFNAGVRPEDMNKYSKTQQLENVQDDPNEDFLTDNEGSSNTQGHRSSSNGTHGGGGANGSLSSKRIFKSAERSFRPQNNISEYMATNNASATVGSNVSNFNNNSYSNNVLSVNANKMVEQSNQSWSPNVNKIAIEFYGHQSSNIQANDFDQLDTVRKELVQKPNSTNTLNVQKPESQNTESILNNSSGQIKLSVNDDKDKSFSISNIKNSLFSKISNIFQKDDQQQIDQSQQRKTKGPKFQCNCGAHPKYPYLCKEAYTWFSRYNNNNLEDYQKLKRIYKQLLEQEVEKETENQIQRDLFRTFPNHEYFKEGSVGVEKLRRVLTAFANYDHQVDYVQGMNFIVASLLYHANEVMAFWLFVSLIEDCELRDIYMHGLPGLFKHSQIIDMLIMENLQEVFSHFLILSILKFLEDELLQEDELWNILNQIKSQTHLNTAAISGQSSALKNSKKRRRKQKESSQQYSNDYQDSQQQKSQDNDNPYQRQKDSNNNYYDSDSSYNSNESNPQQESGKVVSFFKRLFQKQEQDMWLMLIDKSMKEWKFDEGQIHKLLHTWDPEKNTFTQD